MLNNKIQALLINHLQRYGNLKLLLPDGIILEIGTNQIGVNGELVNVNDYCWVTAEKEDKMTILDSYNLGLRFNDDTKLIVFEDTVIDDNGEKIRRLDVV